jgi:hypothetical protein
MPYVIDMSRPPLPRFRADLQVVIDVSALDADDAERRLAVIADEIAARLSKSTFARLEGKPNAVLVALASEPVTQ